MVIFVSTKRYGYDHSYNPSFDQRLLTLEHLLSLVRKLYRDKNYTMSLYIGCGAFFGLRVSDTKRLTWSMLLNDSTFTIIEQKTQKQRTIKINPDFQNHIRKCYTALRIRDINSPCFLSQKNTVYSTQRLNVVLKEIKDQYKVHRPLQQSQPSEILRSESR